MIKKNVQTPLKDKFQDEIKIIKRKYIMKNKREVTFEVIKDIYWDNGSRLTKVFNKGDICKGSQYPTGVVVAESPYYEGVSDVINLEHVNIIKD